MAKLVYATDLKNLSARVETLGVEPVKFGEPYTGNAEPSPYLGEGVET